MITTVLQLVLTNETGDSCYRMRWPARALAEQDADVRVINLDCNATERFTWALEADLLVLYQSSDLGLMPILKERRSRGKKTLVEYNDNYYEYPSWGPVAKHWSSPLLWQIYERFIKESDGMIVTGAGLYELFSKKFPGSPIKILENHLPNQLAPFETLFSPPESELRIGWAGSLGHMADLLAVRPVLADLLQMLPCVQLHIMGNEAIPRLLRFPAERFRFTNFGSMQQYFEFWKPIHIGIAPLLDTAYNRCRSDIKAVEMAGCAVLPLLSAALPYQHFASAVGIDLITALSGFKPTVLSYAHDLPRLSADCKRAYEYVKLNRIGGAHRERLELYRSFFPKEVSQYNWPLDRGYHEVVGSPQNEQPFLAVLKSAKACLDQNKPADALALLRSALKQNSLNPELALAELQCVCAMRREDPIPHIQRGRRSFPGDVRFYILEAAQAKESSARLRAWEEICSLLLEESQTYRAFFQRKLVAEFRLQLSREECLLEPGRKLAGLYPQSIELQLSLAEKLEEQGAYEESFAHFTKVAALLEIAQQNQEFASNLDRGYVQAWKACMEERTKRTFQDA